MVENKFHNQKWWKIPRREYFVDNARNSTHNIAEEHFHKKHYCKECLYTKWCTDNAKLISIRYFFCKQHGGERHNMDFFHIASPLWGNFTGDWRYLPTKGQWNQVLMFSMMCTWTNIRDLWFATPWRSCNVVVLITKIYVVFLMELNTPTANSSIMFLFIFLHINLKIVSSLSLTEICIHVGYIDFFSRSSSS